MTEQKTQRITGIGSALVDVLINETDQFLADLGKKKGGMTYHSDQEIKEILARSSNPPLTVTGGAACNTITGVGRLGGQARFIGQRGKDEYGRLFEEKVRSSGVEPLLTLSDSPTGKVLSVVTPDAQRSMFTDLGASVEMRSEQISEALFKDTAITMIEGYLLFNPDLMRAAIKAARDAGSMIALDLASFEVVHGAKDLLDEIVTQSVDILIANEDEAKAYTGEKEVSKGLDRLSTGVTCAVLKVGAKGSWVNYRGETTRIEPVRGKDPVDTTGAGDLWAAGFLFGLARGFDIETCGKLGSACGYEVCQVMGAQIPEAGWQRIRALI